jgi:alginate O-acetyltransferase complex protein AlgI
MNFVSIRFLGFLALALIAFRLARPAFRLHVMLATSLLFIAAYSLDSALAIIVFAVLTWHAGKRVAAGGAVWYAAGLALNIAGILAFNYGVSFSSQLAAGPSHLLLALGISFYNLQHIAYLVDVRKRRISPEQNPLTFLFCSAWFPKVSSGPLMKYEDLRAQFTDAGKTPDYARSFNRILFGFAKKMCIADRLAAGVSSVFDYNDNLPALTIFAGAVLFTIQLYFDFSGYTDIAIGCSGLFGITLKENFILPLRSQSVTVFWRRWHISLMDFLRTYIFNPVAFRFRDLGRHCVIPALAATFFISAWWHGVGVTFVLWAMCHFLFLTIEYYMVRGGGGKARFGWIGTLWVWIAVSASFIFFRSTSLENCVSLIKPLLTGEILPPEWLADFIAPMATGGHQINLFNFCATLFMAFTALIFEKRMNTIFNSDSFRPLVTFLALLAIFLFGSFGSTARFIYMQF